VALSPASGAQIGLAWRANHNSKAERPLLVKVNVRNVSKADSHEVLLYGSERIHGLQLDYSEF
jgi:hypothetical protein